jgi:hypothetical protein
MDIQEGGGLGLAGHLVLICRLMRHIREEKPSSQQKSGGVLLLESRKS